MLTDNLPQSSVGLLRHHLLSLCDTSLLATFNNLYAILTWTLRTLSLRKESQIILLSLFQMTTKFLPQDTVIPIRSIHTGTVLQAECHGFEKQRRPHQPCYHLEFLPENTLAHLHATSFVRLRVEPIRRHWISTYILLPHGFK